MLHTTKEPLVVAETIHTSAHYRAATRFSSRVPGFICSKCGKSFSVNNDLQNHCCVSTWNKTLTDPKIEGGKKYEVQSPDLGLSLEFHCIECGKTFSRRMGLVEHERIHTGEKPFKCAECGKLFARKSNLQKHEKIHKGEKPFTCTECGKCFSQRITLLIHQNIHTGAKPFTCKECGRSFSKKDNLRRHEKIHIVEKTCVECGKSFTQKRMPEEQKGKKPFTCTECEKKIHIRDLPFKCTECGDGFYQKSHLTIHQKVHEREKLFKCSDVGRVSLKEKTCT